MKKSRYLILTSEFNELVTKPLEDGARRTLVEDAGTASVKSLWVPGAFELPVAASRAALSGHYDAIVCLGAIIKGETPHFDYVAGQAASGVMNVSLKTGVPIAFGVLTTNTIEEAMNRAGLKYGNKGIEAAHTVIKMVRVLSQIDDPARGDAL